jgi:hypothetical protein
LNGIASASKKKGNAPERNNRLLIIGRGQNMTVDTAITAIKAVAPLAGFFLMILVVLWGIKTNKNLDNDKPKRMR